MRRVEFLELVCANTIAIKIKEMADLRAEMKCYMPECKDDIDKVCDLLEKINTTTSKRIRKSLDAMPFE
jgi:hypothetical protein